MKRAIAWIIHILLCASYSCICAWAVKEHGFNMLLMGLLAMLTSGLQAYILAVKRIL